MSITVLLGLLALSSLVFHLLLPPVVDLLERMDLRVPNYRQHLVITCAGLVFVLVAPVVVMGGYLLHLISDREAGLFLLMGTGTGLIGFADDISAETGVKGLRGHFTALVRGRLTAGALKALYTGVLGITVSALLRRPSSGALVDGLILALSGNLFNLLDVRPGRAIKGLLITSLVLVPAVSASSFVVVVLSYVIFCLIYLPWEMDERVMLGDVGANFLGVLAGFTVIVAFPVNTHPIVVIILLSITLLAEKVSFSGVIEENNILRWFDHLGKPRE